MDLLTKIVSRKLQKEANELAKEIASGKEGNVTKKISGLKKEWKDKISSLINRPPVGVYLKEEKIVVLIDVPGFEKKDLEIFIPLGDEFEELRIKGEKKTCI